MRELIYAPVVHTEADLGTLSGAAKGEYIAKYGEEKWNQHVRVITDMWDGLRKKITGMNVPYQSLRIYQDGLPVCGKVMEIVREVAEKGSANYRLVMELVGLGARVEGTEDPVLLLEEYNNLKRLYQASSAEERAEAIRRYNDTEEELLIKRDTFISERIRGTLADGETGLLFIGMEHRVHKYLEGIKITYLIYRLPFKEGLAGGEPR
ncbi:MAG: hypothetical protein WCP22_04605 [Chlamydiota bacterium]